MTRSVGTVAFVDIHALVVLDFVSFGASAGCLVILYLACTLSTSYSITWIDTFVQVGVTSLVFSTVLVSKTFHRVATNTLVVRVSFVISRTNTFGGVIGHETFTTRSTHIIHISTRIRTSLYIIWSRETGESIGAI